MIKIKEMIMVKGMSLIYIIDMKDFGHFFKQIELNELFKILKRIQLKL